MNSNKDFIDCNMILLHSHYCITSLIYGELTTGVHYFILFYLHLDVSHELWGIESLLDQDDMVQFIVMHA